MSKTLTASKLIKNYGKKTIVKEVDIQLSKGEVVGLLGPNGAGKTTTFYMISGLILPSSGKIMLGNQDITFKPMYLRARMGIGY